jgi:hypothetical protein
VGGGGAGGGGVVPPGGREQCATMATVFTTSGQGSGRAFVLTVQVCFPRHWLETYWGKPLSLHEEGAKSGQEPEGVPYSASGNASITPFSHVSEDIIVPLVEAQPQKGFVGESDRRTEAFVAAATLPMRSAARATSSARGTPIVYDDDVLSPFFLPLL